MKADPRSATADDQACYKIYQSGETPRLYLPRMCWSVMSRAFRVTTAPTNTRITFRRSQLYFLTAHLIAAHPISEQDDNAHRCSDLVKDGRPEAGTFNQVLFDPR